MNNSNLTLPIFPLPIFLLPEGITRLRVFEQRYLKMVKIATKGQGFVLWLNTKEFQLPVIKWGSWVEIINFDQGKDGMLEIDVKCKSLVEIKSIDKDSDNLHFGQVFMFSHWSQKEEQSSIDVLAESIDKVFKNDKRLNALYSEKFTHKANWVIARWLELLPIDLTIKNSFVDKHSFEEAKSFIQDIICKEN